jgi:hypothetical protein
MILFIKPYQLLKSTVPVSVSQKKKNVKMPKPQFLHFSTGSQYCLKIFHYSLLGMGEGVGREGTLSQVLASFLLPAMLKEEMLNRYSK